MKCRKLIGSVRSGYLEINDFAIKMASVLCSHIARLAAESVRLGANAAKVRLLRHLVFGVGRLWRARIKTVKKQLGNNSVTAIKIRFAYN